MIIFFSHYKRIFYLFNFSLILLYLFPGSLIGWVIYSDKKIQPQITPDLIVSSNHFFVFLLLSIVGFFTFVKYDQAKALTIYLILLSIVLEILHLIVPQRSFQWSDLFGNLLGVLVVIFIKNLINKYGIFKK
tara:strand:- start:47 stop:442 length:396 start_codon:yes stop_codon:yes gene_type:complete